MMGGALKSSLRFHGNIFIFAILSRLVEGWDKIL